MYSIKNSAFPTENVAHAKPEDQRSARRNLPRKPSHTPQNNDPRMKEKMFPALPEPKTPPRAHNGPFLKSRLPRLTPTARASCPGGVVFSSPVYPLRSSPVVVAAGQPTLSRSLSGGPAVSCSRFPGFEYRGGPLSRTRVFFSCS